MHKYFAICIAALFAASRPAAADIVSWKNFTMPSTPFEASGPISPPQAPGGPTGTDAIWRKTSIPTNPGFIKQQNSTGLTCSFTIAVEPSRLFFSLMIDDASGNSLTGVILEPDFSSGYEITINWTTHMFTNLPAGQYNITTWVWYSSISHVHLDAPNSHLECFEVELPPAQH